MINIGIFTAVYFVLNLVIAAVMGFIPVVNMLIPLVSSMILGIPMMLYFTRIKKRGMVLITYIIYGGILTLAGVGVWTLLAGSICALVAELILKKGDIKAVGWQFLAMRSAVSGRMPIFFSLHPFLGSRWQTRWLIMGRTIWTR